MKLLLDSHALIWAVDEPARLGARALTSMQDPSTELLLSAATIWEIAIKVGLGKLTFSMPYDAWMTKAIAQMSAVVLPITVDHAHALTTLANRHRDPFDRMLIAQCQVERIPIVSSDAVFDDYGTTRLW